VLNGMCGWETGPGHGPRAPDALHGTYQDGISLAGRSGARFVAQLRFQFNIV
jgi:hypothetical protein